MTNKRALSIFVQTIIYLYLLGQTLAVSAFALFGVLLILGEISHTGNLLELAGWYFIIPAGAVSIAGFYLLFTLSTVHQSSKTVQYFSKIAAVTDAAITGLPVAAFVHEASEEIDILYGLIFAINLCILSLVVVPRFHNHLFPNTENKNRKARMDLPFVLL